MKTRSLDDFLEEELGPRTFGRMLAGYRESAGITQAECATRLRIAQSRLSEIERGIRHVTVATGLRFAKRLGWKHPEKAAEVILQEQLRKCKGAAKMVIKVTTRAA
jgi:transcriptional regulator with XRE-family HTH domain